MKRFALLGHPVAHSISPALHRTAYAALGMSAEYGLLDCPDRAAFERAVGQLRAGELAGVNVTLPWKTAALELADDATLAARRAGAANVLSVEAGRLIADNTDVPALVAELRALAPGAREALVIGAGGAALAAVAACVDLGARVTVTARRFDAGQPADQWPGAATLRALGAELVPWPDGGAAALRDAARGAELVIQATSAGMLGGDDGHALASVVPWAELRPGTVAYDLVYVPERTPFVEAARGAGLRAESGMGMLIRQAALAMERWYGAAPDAGALQTAARAAIARRAS